MRSAIFTCLLFVAVSACGVDPASNASPASDDPAISVEESDAAITPLTSGCAHVVWCDEPNSSIGTVCQQDACSLSAAKAECMSDLRAIGCSFHCPGRILLLGGGSSSMCCPGVCSPGCPC